MVGVKWLSRLSGRSPRSGKLHVADPRFDDWPVVRDFEDLPTALAWQQHLSTAGFEGVVTADWPLDQFEDTYWQSNEAWSYADAALKGSSYLNLPRVLQFFTGNIGLHHVHHLSARIPNYNLQRAHDDNPVLHGVPTLSFWDGIRAVRLKLWDERRGRLVTFAEARASG